MRPGRIGRRAEGAGLLAAILILALLPLVVTDTYPRHVLILAIIYAVVASSWDLSLGYGGVFNFAHLALFGIGVYAYGILAKVAGLNPWLAFAAAGLIGAACAVLVTIPILRLRGIYIILVTFGFGQLVLTLVLSQSDLTGGTQGMIRIPTLTLGTHNLLRDGRLGFYGIALALLAASTVFLRVIARSRLGASIVALRDNEEYAVSRGVPVVRQRVLTLAASALPVALAGAFYAAYQRNASIDVFGASLSTTILSMVLLGGTGTIYGPIAASFALTVASEAMADFGPWRPIAIGALIIAVMLAYPRGLAGACMALVDRLRRSRTSR